MKKRLRYLEKYATRVSDIMMAMGIDGPVLEPPPPIIEPYAKDAIPLSLEKKKVVGAPGTLAPILHAPEFRGLVLAAEPDLPSIDSLTPTLPLGELHVVSPTVDSELTF